MTMTEQIQKKRKKAPLRPFEIEIKDDSPKLKALYKRLETTIVKVPVLVKAIFTQAKSEQIPEVLTGRRVRAILEGAGYSERQIERMLPDEAKDMSKSHVGTKPVFKDAGDKMSANENGMKKGNDENDTTSADTNTTPNTESKSNPTTDPFRFFKETIEAKNKLLKEKDEEIAGLRKKIADLEKEITRLKNKKEKGE